MVSPLDNIRRIAGAPSPGSVKRPGATEGSFETELGRALQELDAKPAGDSAAASLLSDDLAASLSLASQSLQRATAHINSARAYFRNAAPPPSADASSVDQPA